MAAVSEVPGGVPCVACRGRGWKFVSARVALVARIVDGGTERLPRQACLACAGAGSVPAGGALVPEDGTEPSELADVISARSAT